MARANLLLVALTSLLLSACIPALAADDPKCTQYNKDNAQKYSACRDAWSNDFDSQMDSDMGGSSSSSAPLACNAACKDFIQGMPADCSASFTGGADASGQLVVFGQDYVQGCLNAPAGTTAPATTAPATTPPGPCTQYLKDNGQKATDCATATRDAETSLNFNCPEICKEFFLGMSTECSASYTKYSEGGLDIDYSPDFVKGCRGGGTSTTTTTTTTTSSPTPAPAPAPKSAAPNAAGAVTAWALLAALAAAALMA